MQGGKRAHAGPLQDSLEWMWAGVERQEGCWVWWAASTSCWTSAASVTFHTKSLGGVRELRCMLARLNSMVLQKRLQHTTRGGNVPQTL